MNNINQEIREKLYNLANIPDTDYPFITLYMNINATKFFEQAEKNRIFFKNAVSEHMETLKNESDNEKLHSYNSDIEKIKDYMKSNVNTETHGLAIFACTKFGIFEAFQSLIPFENEFVADSFPHLKQLAYLGDEYENALVLMLDSRYSKIFEVRLGGFVSSKWESLSDVHRFHKQGGWAQKRYQRGIEMEKTRHYIETAEETARLIDESNYQHFIILGHEFEIKNFEQHLPLRIKEKISAINNINMKENINSIIEAVINDLYKKEKQDEFMTVRNIIGKAQSNDESALGIQEIINLANDGRIDTLAVIKDYDFKGFKCDGCLYVSKEQSKAVTFDGKDKACKETNLLEEVIRLTYKFGGSVELLEKETPAAYELEKHEGIGAYLRY
jgi:peptide chain release factor subunit 1